MIIVMRHVISFILILLSVSVNAQNLVVDEVTLLEGNIYARRNVRNDAAGNACALILVRSTEPKLTFEGDICGDIQYDNATYYVYMPAGATRLEVATGRRSTHTLKFNPLESKATYEVTVGETSDKGSISLTTNPSGADVYIHSKGERILIGKTPIKGNVLIKAGTYRVEVEKKGYQGDRIRKVKVEKGKTTKLGSIKLKAL